MFRRLSCSLISTLVCALAPALASAQVVHVVNDHAATRQVCQNGRCFLVRDQDLGTGVVIACGSASEPAYVLTAGHVVRSQSRSITVRGQGEDQSYAATLVSADHSADVALLRVDQATFSDCVQICVPSGRPMVTVMGLSGQQPHVERATMTSEAQVSCLMRDGDSGGPVLLDGQCVGLVAAIGADYTRIVPARTLERFVSQVCPQCVCRPYRGPLVPIPVLQPPVLSGDPFRRDRYAVGVPGPPGRDGKDGKDAKLLPITVQLDVVDENGKVIRTDKETFQPGEPIKLRFRAIAVK